MPPVVKAKTYREEIRRRFCESLLARRVLITEGRTEYDVYTTAARKLQRLHPDKSLSFELLGISVVNAETDSQVSELGQYYKSMNKKVYAVFDKQEEDARKKIASSVDYYYEATEHGIEDVVLKGIKSETLLAYGLYLVTNGLWPQHLSEYKPYESMGAEEIYNGAVEIVSEALLQEHFSMSTKTWKGVNVMTIHKAKGKEFDEVIIYEGWYQNRFVTRPERIDQARLNLRVAVTRARTRATIMTPDTDPCTLL